MKKPHWLPSAICIVGIALFAAASEFGSVIVNGGFTFGGVSITNDDVSADGVITATGGFSGPLTGAASQVTAVDAGGDTTTFPFLATAATGNVSPSTDAGLSYNATTNVLTAGGLAGPLTGNVTGNVTGNLTGTASNVTTNANLTGPVTSTGNATAITDGGVVLADLADLAQSTVIGRAASAGTGVPTALTATQLTAIGNAFVGDSGSGGTKGHVPAPASGDAAASKYLKADGTWAVVSGSGVGDVTGPGSSTDNALARFDSTTGKIIQMSDVIVDDSENVSGIVGLTITGAFVTPSINVNSGGTISALKMGTFTPTMASVTNVASTSSPLGQYMQVGTEVTQVVVVSVTPTAGGGANTRVAFSLAVASNLGASTDLVGTQVMDSNYASGYVFGDQTNDRGLGDFAAESTSARTVRYICMYRVI